MASCLFVLGYVAPLVLAEGIYILTTETCRQISSLYHLQLAD